MDWSAKAAGCRLAGETEVFQEIGNNVGKRGQHELIPEFERNRIIGRKGRDCDTGDVDQA